MEEQKRRGRSPIDKQDPVVYHNRNAAEGGVAVAQVKQAAENDQGFGLGRALMGCPHGLDPAR
jgi:hypothetical protein